MSRNFSFTSESVSEGHPDKVADQISDAVLDAILTADPRGRVACETMVKTGVVIVAGEVCPQDLVLKSAQQEPQVEPDEVLDAKGYHPAVLGGNLQEEFSSDEAIQVRIHKAQEQVS